MEGITGPRGRNAAMRALIGALVVLVMLAELLHAQSPATVARGRADKNQPKTLKLGKPIERDLRGGETHSYRIHAKAGKFLHVVAEQEAIHVVVTLFDPQGNQLAQTDMLNGSHGPEPLSVLVAASGYFRVGITPNGASSVAGRYKVQLTDLRPPRAEDRLRISAESTYMEGQRLWLRFDAESRKAAIAKWEESFRLWQSLNDSYEQALSLHGIGRTYRALGEKQKALDAFNQALPLWRAAGDRDGEAGTLNDIGCTYNGPGREQKALDYLNQALPLWRAAGDPDGEAWTLNNIGNIHNGLGDKQKALDYYNQALPLWRAAGDRDGEAWALRNIGRAGEAGTLDNIGNVYSGLGERQKALEYYKQALMVWRAAGNRNGEAWALRNIGNVYNGLGEKQKALDCYNQALALSRAAGDRAGEAWALRSVANLYNGLGEKQKALDDFSQALTLWRKMGDRPNEANELRNIANVYMGLGDRQKALDYYNEVLTLWRAAGDRAGEAQALNTIGNVYNGSGEKQLREDYLNEALPLGRATADRNGQAQSVRNVGGAHSGLQDKQKALDYYNQALPLWRAAVDRGGEAGTLILIGRVYYSLQDKQKALDYYNRALLLWRAAQDGNGQAQALRAMAVVYATLWEKQKALDSLNQALALWRASDNRGGEATALTGIGGVYASLREEQKALEYYNQALPLWRVLRDRDGEALTLNCMGVSYDALGEKQKALDYYNQALPLWRAVGDRSGEGLALISIGGDYDVFGEKQKALDYYIQAYMCWRAVRDPDAEAWALNSIGRVYYDLGEKERALEYFTRALPLSHAVQNPDAEAGTLNNIGQVYGALGEKQKALDYCNQALTLWRAAGNREGEGRGLNSVGTIYRDLGEKQKALDCYTQALLLFRAAQNPLNEASTLLLLMEYWKGLGKPPLAIFFGKQGIDRFQQVRRNIQGLEKEVQESFVKSNESYYRELAELLIQEGRLPEAQEILDLLKLEEYAEFSQRRAGTDSPFQPVTRTHSEQAAQQAGDLIEDNLVAVGQEWSDLKKKGLGTTEERTRYDQLSKRLDTANQQWEKYVAGLFEDFGKSDQANDTLRTINTGSRGLQNLLRGMNPGTVALYTLVLDQKCVLFVITPAVMVARDAPVTKADLRTKVFGFVGALARGESDQDLRPRAQDLYRILIGPVEKDLEQAHANTLLWSLDDVLRYLPLAALHDGKQYLAERFANAVFTTTLIANFSQPQVATWRGVAMGVSKDYEGLGELTGVPGELNSVVTSAATKGSHGPVPGTIMLNDSFTEKNLEDALDQPPPVVHIATHFVFNPGDDEKSYLLLSGKDVGGTGYHLSLADLRHKARLNNFVGVELLTLSGCQTAMGSKDSDGRDVDSLGFVGQLDGAKAVLATLWKVDDPSTALLMGTFYRLWVTTAGMTKAEALRRAQLAFLHRGGAASGSSSGAQPSGTVNEIPAEYASPYYWAPFILIGNWK